jgi:hypothetical protein
MREIDKKSFLNALFYGTIFGSAIAIIAFLYFAFIV